MLDFEKNIVSVYGDAGKQWLKNIPNLQMQLAQQFGLRDLKPCAELSYNYVASGFKDNLPIILKMGTNPNEILHEYNALNAFHGNGMIDVIDHDLTKGAILIRRAIPGKTLISLFPKQDKMALQTACKLIDKIHKSHIPNNHQFPTLQEWLHIIDQDWDLPAQHLKLARKLKAELLRSSQLNVLLHGDVHYANILSDGKNWVMIDPKGVIGDPLYDMTGALLREPFNEVMQTGCVDKLLMLRMKFVAKYTKSEVKIIWDWTYVQTLMSICWSLEDGQDISRKLKFLDILYVVRPK